MPFSELTNKICTMLSLSLRPILLIISIRKSIVHSFLFEHNGWNLVWNSRNSSFFQFMKYCRSLFSFMKKKEEKKKITKILISAQTPSEFIDFDLILQRSNKIVRNGTHLQQIYWKKKRKKWKKRIDSAGIHYSWTVSIWNQW